MNVSAEAQIRKVLYPGERLIWAGRSRNGLRLNFGMLFAVLFFLVWSGSILRVAARNFLDDDHTTSDVLFPIAMASVGLAILAGLVFVDPRHRSKIAYGLTNKRALIVGGLFNRIMVSMPLEFIYTVTVREQRDLSGTLVFEDFVRQCGEDADETCPYEFRDIEGVRRVHALIKVARGNLLSSRAEHYEAAS